MPHSLQQEMTRSESGKLRSHRTSTVGSPVDVRRNPDLRCSERPVVLLARKTAESTPVARARDATGIASLGNRCYGCHVVELYNLHRPHSSLGHLTPTE